MIRKFLKSTFFFSTASARRNLQFYEDSGDFESHKSIIEKGYYFNKEGVLRSIGNDSPYQFTGDQKGYEVLCDSITKYIQEVLMEKYKMERVRVPLPNGPCSIFLSDDFKKNVHKALVLIQGTGQVRAGVWSRYCCVNDSLETGSMIPYIKQGMFAGYSSIILNPNEPHGKEAEKKSPLVKMAEHCDYVWEKLVESCPAKEIFIVAHSAGGYCVTDLLKRFGKTFIERVSAVALTDAMFGDFLDKSNFVKSRVVQFAKSDKEAGTELGINEISGMRTLSAGHPRHEYTTGYARGAIFKLFREQSKAMWCCV